MYSLRDQYHQQIVCKDPTHQGHPFWSQSLAKDSNERHQLKLILSRFCGRVQGDGLKSSCSLRDRIR
jgi:hypothetical protein